MKNSSDDIIKQINTVLIKIQAEFPEVYNLLDEDPMTLHYSGKNEKIDNETLTLYLKSLKAQLKGISSSLKEK